MPEDHIGMLGMDLELCRDPFMVVIVHAAGQGDLVPAGIKTSVSARRRAERRSLESIIAAVRLAWLTLEPVRGRQEEPVWASNISDE
ncbi:hypothetical protein GGE68_001875 [Rhizobium leguminosarum]|nr:hypothetical protein [Rhizobium leguminosarum]